MANKYGEATGPQAALFAVANELAGFREAQQRTNEILAAMLERMAPGAAELEAGDVDQDEQDPIMKTFIEALQRKPADEQAPATNGTAAPTK